MKTTEYLYGTSETAFSDMRYTEALKHKIYLANQVLTRLLDTTIEDRDTYRIGAVYNAVQFNKKLLDELTSERNI
jgi:hypothetical protein